MADILIKFYVIFKMIRWKLHLLLLNKIVKLVILIGVFIKCNSKKYLYFVMNNYKIIKNCKNIWWIVCVVCLIMRAKVLH